MGLLLAIGLAAPAVAHEIWIERDGQAPARVYFGEPADPEPDHGQDDLARLKAPVVFTGTARDAAPLERRKDHLEAAVKGLGDVRLADDSLFRPRKNPRTGAMEAYVFHARAGRSETSSALDLEIVPAAANGDQFAVLFKGKPVASPRITVIDPGKWEKTFKAGADGRVTVPARGTGRYILVARHVDESPQQVAGEQVALVRHVSTLTFVRP